MPVHDISYQHWEGAHLGVWHRRWVIAANGLRGCLQAKGMQHLVLTCWLLALVMVAIQFAVGQLLVADSIIVQWIGNFNPQLQTFAKLLTTWLEQHPEISVRTTQNILFHYFSIWLMPLGIFGLGLAIPLLITRDLASSAIVVYASKAVSRGDYFMGKFATALGLLTLTWLGPVCAAWFVGNLLAPDWRFFWHARAALGHAVLFGLVMMPLLSALALGVSAISPKEKATPALWFMWWVLGGVLAPIARHTEPWLRHLSFNFNFDQIALALFRPGNDLEVARANIPVLGEMVRNIRPATMAALNEPAAAIATLALLGMVAAAAFILHRQVRPE